jgi:hypothetical protein
MLVDGLLGLRVPTMRRELNWNVSSSVRDVSKTRQTLEVELQVVVRSATLPTRRCVLKVCRRGARAIRRLVMGHLGLVAQHMGLAETGMIFYSAYLYQLRVMLQTMLLKCLNWRMLLQKRCLAWA